MYFEDMTLYRYYRSIPLDKVKNVGWLDAEHVFSKGRPDEAFLDKLAIVILGSASFDPCFNQIRGFHRCNLCESTELVIEDSDKPFRLGSCEILIPELDCVGQYFASPSIIYHYVNAHSYLPPRKFIDSVMAIDLDSNFNAEDVFDGM